MGHNCKQEYIHIKKAQTPFLISKNKLPTCTCIILLNKSIVSSDDSTSPLLGPVEEGAADKYSFGMFIV